MSNLTNLKNPLDIDINEKNNRIYVAYATLLELQ